MQVLKEITKENILEQMETFHKLNQSNTVCVSKFHFLKINPFGNSVLSCYKAKSNPIDFSQLKDITSLNDLIKLTPIYTDRQEMLEGKKPSSCDFCWKVETHPDAISQRHQDSIVKHGKRASRKLDIDQKIEFLEVSLNNTCSLRCIYCSPNHSSRIEADRLLNGSLRHEHPFTIAPHHQLTKEQRETNQRKLTELVVKAIPELRTLMLTGGEPLLDDDIWTILSALEEPRDKPLSLSIVTNLNHKKPVLDRLINKIKQIKTDKVDIIIVVSCDTIGEEAEIIRDGLDYDLLISNVSMLLSELKDMDVLIMINATISSLSVKSTVRWIHSLEDLFSKYPLLVLNISTVNGQDYLTTRALPVSVIEQFIKDMDSVIEHPIFKGRISNWETARNRLEHDMKDSRPNQTLMQLKQHLKERSLRYNKDATVLIKWIDSMLLGY